jgi:transcriptional regulator with XRE-family HTH domain
MRGFDMTQQEFADRVGVSQTYVSDMELGKVEIGAEIVLRIAEEFGRSMEWLLTGEDRPKP